MTAAFEKARAEQTRLDEEHRRLAAKLQSFPRDPDTGLHPDHVKFSPEYRAAKGECDAAFTRLRNFNARFVSRFGKEIRAARRTAKHWNGKAHSCGHN